MSNYPTSLDTNTELPDAVTGSAIPAIADTNRSRAILALENKVGINTSTPVANTVLRSGTNGESDWEKIEVQDINATGTPNSSSFLRGDGSWSTPAGGGGGDLLAANNLSDVDNVATARTNLGLDTTANQTDSTNKRFMTDAQETKLDGIEANADVTDTANVTSAGALMDSEVTNLADVKAFNSSDYATSAQGSTADTALQPSDIASGAITARTGAVNLSGGSDGDVLTVQADGSLAPETPAAGGGGSSVFMSASRAVNVSYNGTNIFVFNRLDEAPSAGSYNTANGVYTVAADGAGWYQVMFEYKISSATTRLDIQALSTGTGASGRTYMAQYITGMPSGAFHGSNSAVVYAPNSGTIYIQLFTGASLTFTGGALTASDITHMHIKKLS